ncbi:hypothetical protein AB0B30_32430 [Streptomyces narbonensis]|uniref:Uncharacterized protein n=1 Tax=Streptomyces narbonensis TaxID=67333 RepID=A0ABV3CJ00_9ACTN
MTSFTPNQFIPYSDPTDPTDIPNALKDAAEQIDFSLGVQEDRGRPRAMAQVLGTITNAIPGVMASGNLTWQTIDFNTVDVTASTPTNAIQPLISNTTTAITVNRPGFWFIYGTVQAMTTVPAANIDELGLEILLNNSATPTNCRHGSHDTTTSGVSSFLIDASCGLLLTSGDTIGLRALVRRASGAETVFFGRRSLTLLRMTLS